MRQGFIQIRLKKFIFVGRFCQAFLLIGYTNGSYVKTCFEPAPSVLPKNGTTRKTLGETWLTCENIPENDFPEIKDAELKAFPNSTNEFYNSTENVYCEELNEKGRELFLNTEGKFDFELESNSNKRRAACISMFDKLSTCMLHTVCRKHGRICSVNNKLSPS